MQLSYNWCNWCNLGLAVACLYPERESKSLEFKVKLPQFQQLVKTCVAFANGAGGKIIIGIDDKTREIVGVDDEIRHRIYDEFPNSLYDMTNPSLLAEIYEQTFDDKNVMIIQIPSSIKKPVFIKKEGIPQGVYLRAGSNTRKATQDYVEELMRENKRIYFDEEPALNTNYTEILSLNLLKNLFDTIEIEKLLTEKIIVPSAISTKKHYPTNTGILFFCDSPEKYIAEAFIQCTRFSGTEGRNIIQTEEVRGTLDRQIDISFQLIKSWLTRDYDIFDARLRGRLLIPEIALREAIINAAIHRKYWIPGTIKIALYDDRLEVFNPGNFPGLMSTHHLGDGTTYLRNPHLARIARRMGLVEKLGTGIKLIFESVEKRGLQAPIFEEGADSVKVVFSFLPKKQDDLSEDKALLNLFKVFSEVRLQQVESFFSISRNTATRKLNRLIESGKIRRIGKGPGVRYKLNQERDTHSSIIFE